MPTGGLVSILVLLPNLLWMLFPPHDQPEEGGPPTKLHRLMEILEWVGRVGVLVIPFFYRIEVQITQQIVALAVMAVSLLVYYAGWARYFMRGRSYALLFEPLLGVPLPLAISPVVCFLSASVLFRSWYLALATVILAIGHLWISYQAWREIPSSSGDLDATGSAAG